MKKINPNFVNSNIAKGCKDVDSSMKELTIKFVEVPINVSVPPNIAAYDNGNNNFDGLI